MFAIECGFCPFEMYVWMFYAVFLCYNCMMWTMGLSWILAFSVFLNALLNLYELSLKMKQLTFLWHTIFFPFSQQVLSSFHFISSWIHITHDTKSTHIYKRCLRFNASHTISIIWRKKIVLTFLHIFTTENILRSFFNNANIYLLPWLDLQQTPKYKIELIYWKQLDTKIKTKLIELRIVTA